MSHQQRLEVIGVTEVAGERMDVEAWAEGGREHEFMKESVKGWSDVWNENRYCHERQGPTFDPHHYHMINMLRGYLVNEGLK